MKTIKKLILAIIFIAIAMFILEFNTCNAAEEFEEFEGFVNSKDAQKLEDVTFPLSAMKPVHISQNSFVRSNFTYCISAKKAFAPKDKEDPNNYYYLFYLHAAITIKGNTSTLKLGSNIKPGEFVNVATVDHPSNGIMAAILGGNLSRGHFGQAQSALFSFYKKWFNDINNEMINKYGNGYNLQLMGLTDNGQYNDGSGNSAYVEQAKNDISEDLEVTIYIFKPATTWTEDRNVQELIVVDAPDPEPDPKPKKYDGYINISGTVWEDGAANKSNTIDGYYNGKDGIQGVQVSLKHPSYTFKGVTTATTDSNGKYALTINYIDDAGHNYPYHLEDRWDVVDKYLNDGQAYLEFKYNGYTYTTVAPRYSETNTSKGEEDPGSRNNVDSGRTSEAIAKTYIKSLISREDTVVKCVEYCNADGEMATYKYTNTANWPNSSHIVSTGVHSRSIRFNQYGYGGCNIDTHTDGGMDNNVHLRERGYDYKHKIITKKYKCGCGNESVDHTETITCATDYEYAARMGCKDETGLGCGKHIKEEIVYYTCTHREETKECTHPHPGSCVGIIEEIKDYTEYKYCYQGYGGHPVHSRTITCLYFDDVNLGLFVREQPEAALVSDIAQVRVVTNKQEFKYIYGEKELYGEQVPDDVYKVQYGSKFKPNVYSRPVNPSDIAALTYTQQHEMDVYVTYNIKVKNYSQTLKLTIDKIVNYFDPKYELYEEGSPNWSMEDDYKGYKKAIYSKAMTIDAQKESPVVEIELQVKQEALKQLLNKEALLNNISEISAYTTRYGATTLIAEEKHADSKEGDKYAGKLPTTPNSAIPGKPETYENDTDQAPAFLLHKETDTDGDPREDTEKALKYKILSGNIWEDLDHNVKDAERLGNGSKDEGEKGIQNVKVELLEVDKNGNIKLDNGQPIIAKLYRVKDTDQDGDGYNDVEVVDAVTYTDKYGNYAFGNNGEDKTKRIGIAVGKYVIRYTYGNADKGKGYQSGFVDATPDENKKQQINPTTIEGSTEINARNYKSTIIQDYIKKVLQGDNKTEEDPNGTKWHLTMDKDETVSVAVDDLEQRMNIPDLKYGTYEDKVNMSAYTKPVEIQVEYTVGQTKQMVPNANGNVYGKLYYTNADETETSTFEKSLDVFDFGIIERPREDIVVSKTISKIKVILANEQKIIEGVPGSDTMDYVKAIGFGYLGPAAINQRNKLLTIEIDSEIIQGARLEVWYEISVQNNSEIDYEYENQYAFMSNTATDAMPVPIVNKDENKAIYYYYGEKMKDDKGKVTHEQITTDIIVADYMTKELDCKVGEESKLTLGEQEHDNMNWYKFDKNFDIKDKNETEIKYIDIQPAVNNENAEAITAELLRGKGYISEKTEKTLLDEDYQIFVTNTFNGLKPGDTPKTSTLFASKLLSNKDEEGTDNDFSFDNHVEIIHIDTDMARTIEAVDDDRKQVPKEYKPGDYIPEGERQIPETEEHTINGKDVEIHKIRTEGEEIAGLHYQDDDKVRIVITPPTGTTSSYVTPNYTIAAIVGLVVIVIGIIFIKKKVISK